MLWAVQHEWHSGAKFTFNCYHHWVTLVVRETRDGLGHFLHSKERVTQGDPLAMIAYGIGILPLIRDLWYTHPQITHSWYADEAGSGGETCRGSNDGGTGGAPVTAGTSNATSGKDRGLDHGAAVYSQRDGAGGPGMA